MRTYWKLPLIGVAIVLTLGPAKALIGGDLAGTDDFPWEIGLQKPGEDIIRCGGVHLGSGWIVTAAHCVKGSKRGDVNVFYGSTSVLSGGHSIPLTADPFIHEEWKPQYNFQNDIALVKVNAPADLAAARIILNAVEIPTIGQGATLTISGWGRVDINGPNNLELRKAELTVGDRKACAALFAPEPLSEAQVCVGSRTAGACHGDSGGPVTGLDANGVVLIGITSKSGPDCALKYPTVFTRITQFRQWIRTTCENSGLSPGSCPH